MQRDAKQQRRPPTACRGRFVVAGVGSEATLERAQEDLFQIRR